MHLKGRDLSGGPRNGQAVGGGCQSGWGQLLSVPNAIETGTCRQGDVAGHRLGALEGEGGHLPPSNASLGTSCGDFAS